MYNSENPSSSPSPPQVISINTTTFIPHKLSKGGNYSMWSSQMTNFFLEYYLMGFLESPISFEELIEKPLKYETSLKSSDLINDTSSITPQIPHKGNNSNQLYQISWKSKLFQQLIHSTIIIQPIKSELGPTYNRNQPRVVCQLCDKPIILPKDLSDPSNWTVDFLASHDIILDLQNLKYGGNEDIMVGDGSNIPITHIGFTTLKSCGSTIKLNNILSNYRVILGVRPE
ncbi:hypothetical protein Pfo_003637 [Paulownia fortunei]|nr:hypothetical protein Pfo_003637 [Paulownia fortunei]